MDTAKIDGVHLGSITFGGHVADIKMEALNKVLF